MVKPIIQIGDKRLSEQSTPITSSELSSKRIRTLIQDLKDTASVPGLNSVGLSAVQLGILEQVFVCRRIDLIGEPDQAPFLVVINPEVIILDSTPQVMWEGCLSIGQGRAQLFAPVARPRAIELHYLDEQGSSQTLQATDYFGHIVQHEVDHLHGKLFLRYVLNPANIWRSDKLDSYIEKHGDYPPLV